MCEPIGSVQQTEPCLLVERRVVGEPQHHRASVGIEVAVPVAVEQRLDHCRRHHRLARAGGRRQRKRHRRPISLPVVPGLREVGQHLGDGVGLVVLQRVTHGYSRPVLIVKLAKYDA